MPKSQPQTPQQQDKQRKKKRKLSVAADADENDQASVVHEVPAKQAQQPEPPMKKARKPAKASVTQDEETSDPKNEKTTSAPVPRANPLSRTTATTLSQITQSPFSKLSIDPLTLRALKEVLKYPCMTVVQDKACPVALTGVDLLAKAKTGTGKTLAFLIPAIENALRTRAARRRTQISCLVVSPTRELAFQIQKECEQLITYHGLQVMCVIGGGAKPAHEAQQLCTRVPDLLIGTPGRLNDHLSQPNIRKLFLKLDTFILDEADQLMDMGFKPAITQLVGALPPIGYRQTLLFSATLPPDVRHMLDLVMRSGHKVVDTIGADEATHEHVQQQLVVTSMHLQMTALLTLVREAMLERDHKVMVFFTTARLTQLYSEAFALLGVPVLEMHSRKAQSQRNKMSAQFRDGTKIIMFSSDVSARGMDYPGVTKVIQVGCPQDRAQYIHRLGRTARAGCAGAGVLLLADFEKNFIKLLTELPLEQRFDAAMSDSTLTSQAASVFAACRRLPRPTVASAYQALLGFYAPLSKRLGFDKAQLVAIANKWVTESICSTKVPGISYKTLGRMSMAGVRGIVVSDQDDQYY